MEPEPILPAPRPMSEPLSSQISTEQPLSSPTDRERGAQRPETLVATPQAVQPVQLQSVQPAQIPVTDPVSQVPPQTVPAAAGPAIADDVDVIEKEWVDKAKKIVSATKDDPHVQEKEVSKLQADYLLKRYGKQIKLVD
ncbi:hypothetical protein KBD20_00770 [Candidatus Saccharibacteria bacterium]|nr:hypothetical protein [Candidatus Saccharibacteria bacterium]